MSLFIIIVTCIGENKNLFAHEEKKEIYAY